MRSVKAKGSRIIIKQIPILLFIAVGILSVPLFIFGLANTILQTGAEGSTFSLIFGLVFGWIMFEYVATREELIMNWL
ncbi:MAG: hypothetical protein AB1489_14460 [Acidobacteriota bacterium]